MKVHVAGPTSPTASAVCRILRERGYIVSHSDHIPPDADLYFFCGGHEAIKVLPHGLVILDLRGDTTFAAAPWMPYADLCLASNDQDRTALVDIHGCEPERIFLVADDNALGDLVDRAVRDALPPAYNERRDKTMTDHSAAMRSEDRLAPQMADLPARLDGIEHQADIMLRGYQVRSRAPLIGPLIAWVRRNLTSHLREPYLDPTFEHQVAVNRELVTALRELLDRQADLERRLARFEEEQQHD
jgi:hypothetical protein